MTYKLIILSTSTLLFISCSAIKTNRIIRLNELKTPPGTQIIAENYFLDKNEIRNINYLEFLNWNRSVYGLNSEEYKNLQPEITFWQKIDTTIVSLETLVLKKPDCKFLSVMGVSLEQAQKFTKWRSDRVMEFMLINYNVIEYQPIQSKDSFFTIEKYFKGRYNSIHPNPNILFYPEYSLLDSTQCTKNGFKNSCVFKKWEL